MKKLIVFVIVLLSLFGLNKIHASELNNTTMIQSDDYLFIANQDSGKILVFNNSGNSVGAFVTTINVGGSPSDLIIDGNNLYVALNNTNSIKIVNKNTFSIVGELQTPKKPSQLALDGNLLWVTVSRTNGGIDFNPFALLLDEGGLTSSATYQPDWINQETLDLYGDLAGNEQILINPNTHEAYLACSGYSPDDIKKFDISNHDNPTFIIESSRGDFGANGQEMNLVLIIQKFITQLLAELWLSTLII